MTGSSDYTADTPSSTGYLGIEPDWAVLDQQGQYRVAHVVPGSPADLGKVVADETDKWAKVIKAGGVALE